MSATLTADRLVSTDHQGHVLADLPVADAGAVAAAVARARASQRGWADLGLDERIAILRRVGDVLIDRADEVAGRIAAENGKIRAEALQGEVLAVLETLRYYCAHAPRLLKPQTLRPRLFPHRVSHVLKVPCGMVAAIAPWNYPMALALWPTIPALVAGNTVVLKPSEKTPASGELIAELFRAGGLPAGVLEVVQGPGATGGALVDADVDRVSFTGSVATGRRIAARCGERLIPCTLELGGKDPAIVLADADLDQAADCIVWGAFANAGQICASVERVLAVDEVAEALTERIVARTDALRLGPDDQLHRVGAAAGPDRGGQAEFGGVGQRDRVVGVADADDRQHRPEGLLAQDAGIAGHVDEHGRLERGAGQVVAGPAAGEHPGAAVDGILHMGGNQLALARVDHRPDVAARRVRASVVLHNDAVAGATSIETPWGGQGASGLGFTRGERGLLEMVDELHVSEERLHLRHAFYWYPYRRGSYDALLAALPVLFSSSRRARLRALAPLAKALVRARRRGRVRGLSRRRRC